MNTIAKAMLVSIVALLLSGCAGSLASAIRAYGVTAEEQASTMKITFERCLTESSQIERDAMCNSVKSSIEAYRRSAAELKTIKASN